MRKPLEIVVVGGGTAGWMTAAGLTGLVSERACRVRLIESDEIGTVGVGEATLPQIKDFNDRIGLIEAETMRATAATFKLGIAFEGWGAPGTDYVHPFGAFGEPIGGLDFLPCWLRARGAGQGGSVEDYSLPIAMARAGRFDFPAREPDRIESTYAYAYHLDAALYARELRRLAESRGVTRTEGRIDRVETEGGDVTALVLASGERVTADLFVDCSGFRSLLLGEALAEPFDDWSRWLPCDRAVALPTSSDEPPRPYTRAVAREAGWQWRIPLQHRTGNGYVFASAFASEDEAHRTLTENVGGEALRDARVLSFTAGRRRRSWAGNVVGIGLASGFLEPLESTSLYLVQVAIERLAELLPRDRTDRSTAATFNRLVDAEYDKIRDFLILHYKLNGRVDGELWRHCRGMEVPDSLSAAIEQFAHRGLIDAGESGLFAVPSWLAVFLGQGLTPRGHDKLADNLPMDQVLAALAAQRSSVAEVAERLPAHEATLNSFCPAPTAVAA